MKTVCVFATLELSNGSIVLDVMEHSWFGESGDYVTASCFIKYCQDMWKKNCNQYKITNVVIG